MASLTVCLGTFWTVAWRESPARAQQTLRMRGQKPDVGESEVLGIYGTGSQRGESLSSLPKCPLESVSQARDSTWPGKGLWELQASVAVLTWGWEKPEF